MTHRKADRVPRLHIITSAQNFRSRDSRYFGKVQMDDAAGFRILFRVQIGKALYIQETSLDTYFGGRRITIKSDEGNQPLSQAEWIVLSTRGFSTETEAQHFGEKLRTAMKIAALCTCLGIDTGEDKYLSSFNQDLLRSKGINIQTGLPRGEPITTQQKCKDADFISCSNSGRVTTGFLCRIPTFCARSTFCAKPDKPLYVNFGKC